MKNIPTCSSYSPDVCSSACCHGRLRSDVLLGGSASVERELYSWVLCGWIRPHYSELSILYRVLQRSDSCKKMILSEQKHEPDLSHFPRSAECLLLLDIYWFPRGGKKSTAVCESMCPNLAFLKTAGIKSGRALRSFCPSLLPEWLNFSEALPTSRFLRCIKMMKDNLGWVMLLWGHASLIGHPLQTLRADARACELTIDSPLSLFLSLFGSLYRRQSIMGTQRA